jgi:imidazolonepropionase
VAETYLLRGARQLLTLRGPGEPRRGTLLNELSIIPDGAILVRDGRIEEIGPTRRVENLRAARSAIEIDVTGRVVMPAFVDSGVNLVYAHSATDRNAARMQSGLPETARGQRDEILDAVRALRLISARRLGMRAAAQLSAMARHGTGLVGVVSGFGLDYTCELKSLRVAKSLDGVPLDLTSSYFGGNTIPEDFQGSPDAYVDGVAIPLFDVILRRRLARIAAVRCSPSAFDTRLARNYLSAARQVGMAVSVHSLQFEHDESVGLALEHDAVAMMHLEHMSPSDVEALARSNTVAILTPAASFHMGLTRFAPARELIDRGAFVALATAFNPDSCPSFSMPFVISLACRYLVMTAAEAITASTINAAYAQGKGDRTGSLEAGKQADLLILNARDYRELPQQAGVNLVHTVMKKGRILYQQSNVTEGSSLNDSRMRS